jgi:hypothetical protein
MSTYVPYDYAHERRMYQRRRVLRWAGIVCIALGVVIAAGYGCKGWVKRGRAARDAMPPRVVAERVHSQQPIVHNCGKGCSWVQMLDTWTLVAEDGSTCSVSVETWARSGPGSRVKCPTLYGWEAP